MRCNTSFFYICLICFISIDACYQNIIVFLNLHLFLSLDTLKHLFNVVVIFTHFMVFAFDNSTQTIQENKFSMDEYFNRLLLKLVCRISSCYKYISEHLLKKWLLTWYTICKMKSSIKIEICIESNGWHLNKKSV